MNLTKIAELVGGRLVGDPHTEITDLAKIQMAGAGHLTFLANPKYAKYLETTKASAILVSVDQEPEGVNYIQVADPYLAFLEVLSTFYPPKNPDFSGIHPSSVVNDSAVIDQSAQIGPNVYIGASVTIGANTVIYPNCTILDGAQIGANCCFYPSVSVREGCQIGNDVRIHDGTVVGSDGFGFAPDGEKYKKIPQMGIVVIKDGVEIGANCTIDRATLGETVIGRGCKIDNLVQIAHNVIIEENTVIAAQTGVSGSTKVGKHVTLAGQVGVVGHIEIGDNVIIAAQSGVSKSVPAGEVWFGYPASPIMKQKKIEASLRHLPELVKKVNSLKAELKNLEMKLTRLGGGK